MIQQIKQLLDDLLEERCDSTIFPPETETDRHARRRLLTTRQAIDLMFPETRLESRKIATKWRRELKEFALQVAQVRNSDSNWLDDGPFKSLRDSQLCIFRQRMLDICDRIRSNERCTSIAVVQPWTLPTATTVLPRTGVQSVVLTNAEYALWRKRPNIDQAEMCTQVHWCEIVEPFRPNDSRTRRSVKGVFRTFKTPMTVDPRQTESGFVHLEPWLLVHSSSESSVDFYGRIWKTHAELWAWDGFRSEFVKYLSRQ